MTVEWHELSDYLAREIEPDQEAELERALFEDPSMASAAAAFLALVDGIVAIRLGHGTLSTVLTPASLDDLRARIELVEITITNGQIVGCHIPENASMCVAHLVVDFHGVTRADLEFVSSQGVVYARFHDIPIPEAAGRLQVACERHLAMIEEVTIFRVVAVDRSEQRVLGEYGVRNEPLPS